MHMQRFLTLFALILFAASGAVCAGDEIPGAAQRQPIALINATIYTAVGAPIQNGVVVFDKGVITQIGASVQIPQDARTIDCKGARVYPGFIAPSTTLGLTEIDAVRATRDIGEVGDINPNARAETAYNPDSEIIPTVRSNGVLLANSTPQGGLVSGQASLMRLDGWTREDLAVQRVSGLLINWPPMEVVSAWWQRKSADEQRKDIERNVRDVYELFKAARGYSEKARAGVDTALRDIRFEAMRCVFEDSVPVIVECVTQRQIESVLDFAQTLNVRVILSGATDASRVIDQLQKARVGLIIPRVHSLPRHDEDGYDAAFTLPAMLAKSGIPFAFSEIGAWQQRNLPFNAGTARAFGLSELDALRGLTLWPAQMFGVASRYGSLEVGKSATLFVSTGDAMDSKANNVIHAFIDGRELELSNRHKRLAKKYRERSKR